MARRSGEGAGTGADGSAADLRDGVDPDEDAGEAGEGVEPVDDVRSSVVEPALQGDRLDRALAALVPEFSRSHLQALIRDGRATVDGRVVDAPSARLSAGQSIAVVLVPPAESRAFVAEDIPLQVVHEDEEVAVVDKPAGLVVHPAAGNWSGTLLNGVLARWPASARLPRAGIVHRLDKDTSGLLVLAKTIPAQTALVRALAARAVSRRYLAIVHGTAPAGPFTVDAPIGRDPAQRTRMAVTTGGKEARTHVERVGFAAIDGGTVRTGRTEDRASALVCALETGRTHQIRVHLAAQGLPLVGDRTYGGRPALGLTRQALHAARLAFRHPTTGRRVDLASVPPADFAFAWARVTDRPPRA
jgi:23S rRNA pseudouridine1911/1915/1917 synthase